MDGDGDVVPAREACRFPRQGQIANFAIERTRISADEVYHSYAAAGTLHTLRVRLRQLSGEDSVDGRQDVARCSDIELFVKRQNRAAAASAARLLSHLSNRRQTMQVYLW
jgi:hypothetical protein